VVSFKPERLQLRRRIPEAHRIRDFEGDLEKGRISYQCHESNRDPSFA